MRFLVFTTDTLPLPGLPTSGTALRTYGLIRGLESQGHEVLSFVPQMAYDGLLRSLKGKEVAPDVAHQIREFEHRTFTPDNQGALVRDLQPDAVLCGHWPALCLRVKPSQALIVDLAGPHLLERYYQRSPDQIAATIGKLSAIATADYYIVSGPSQRYYFLSFLFRAGVSEPERRIATITMPLDPNLPAPRSIANGEFPRFIFGGVFLPWQNPSWSLRHVVGHLNRVSRGSLQLVGGKHPNYPINEGLYGTLFEELSRSPRVTVKPMLPFDAFTRELQNADVAVDLMEWNLERQLAITIRSTTYLWSGLPVIYNDFADLGALIRRYDAGWCIRPGDESALSETLDEIMASPGLVEQKSRNARRLAQEEFSWNTAIRPLLDLLSERQSFSVPEADIILDFPQNADLSIYGGREVHQEFLSRIDGLSKVQCRIATHGRTIWHPVTFTLSALDECGAFRGGDIIATQLVEPKDLVNNEWAGLECSPMPDSAGKRFLLTLSSEAQSEAEAISPWAANTSFYPLLSLTYGGRVLRHTSLCFLTSSATSFREPLREVVGYGG